MILFDITLEFRIYVNKTLFLKRINHVFVYMASLKSKIL